MGQKVKEAILFDYLKLYFPEYKKTKTKKPPSQTLPNSDSFLK